MKIIGRIYQLVEGKKWKIGGELVTDGAPPSALPDIKASATFDTEQEALEALKEYCSENKYILELK